MTGLPTATGKVGDPFWPLAPALVKRALGLLRRALAAMVGANGGLAQLYEPTLNHRLGRHLAELARDETPPVGVVPEGAVYADEVGGAYSETKTGEPDFQFHFSESRWDRAKYLALECKRVSGVKAGNHAAEYANNGVGRFVEGTYSKGHAWALMAGYVYEGDVPQAVEFVANHVAANADRLNVVRAFAVAVDIAHDAYSSRHNQAGTGTSIRLLHYFASIH